MKTTREMIEVMQAWERGEKVDHKNAGSPMEWVPLGNITPYWNWSCTDYRIAPKPLECWTWLSSCNDEDFPALSGLCGSKEWVERTYAGCKGRAIRMREVTDE